MRADGTSSEDARSEEPILASAQQKENGASAEPARGPEAARDPQDEAAASPAQGFFIVGVGASAGGLEALGQFFSEMPETQELAFIVVQHLSPDYKSFMVELLSRRTKLTVSQVKDGDRVQPGHVYLNPPKRNIKVERGHLRLVEPVVVRGVNLPIDVLFRSLAEDLGPRAIGVVLSGTGSDGTSGIRSIKESGGMVMVQKESSAQFDGMPRSAIGTGLADYILPPEEMPRQLLRFIQHPFVVEERGLSRDASTTELQMSKIFSLIKERSGTDFSHYKPSTVDRRIERRMSINQIDSLEEYTRFLERSPREVTQLFHEFLIPVTRFFRDRDSFEALRELGIRDLVKRETVDRVIRIWVPGCSTGEEAYTLAILFAEEIEQQNVQRDVKIFATEISREAVDAASLGVYTESTVANVPPELIDKYFSARSGGYQVANRIRQKVVFAPHDLLKDPPFTRLDLISCRNVLIYFQPILQSRVLSYFHFGLKKDGYLFLGSSETPGELGDQFKPVSLRHKVYKSVQTPTPRALPIPQTVGTPHTRAARQSAQTTLPIHSTRHVKLDSLLRQVVRDYAPPFLIVNQNNEILHVFGQVSKFLSVPEGTFSQNLFKLVSAKLSSVFATAIHKAAQEGGDFTYENVDLEVDGESVAARVRVQLVEQEESDQTLKLIFIEPTGPSRPAKGVAEEFSVEEAASIRIRELEQELSVTRESLQSTIEELETANEELQATNEELMASNEELQSTNEELQSVNEELHTVNAENQERIADLIELGNDITNLLKSSHVGTMLVDDNFRIRKVSPATYALTSLTEEDLGSPLEVLGRALRYPEVVAVAEQVMETGDWTEREVTQRSGSTLLLRLVPYRTDMGEIRGCVITIIDITDRKRAERKLQQSESRFRVAMMGTHEAFFFLEVDDDDADTMGDFIIREINGEAERLLGLNRENILGQRLCRLIPFFRTSGLMKRFHEVIGSGETLVQDVELATPQLHADVVTMQAVPAVDGLALSLRDVSEHRLLEKDLRRAAELFELAQRLTLFGVWDWSPQESRFSVSGPLAEMLSLEEAPESFEGFLAAIEASDRSEVERAVERVREGEARRVCRARVERKGKDPLSIELTVVSAPSREAQASHILGIVRDIDEAEKSQQRIDRRDTLLRGMFEAGYEGLAFLKGVDGRYQYVNEVFLQRTGMTVAEVVGKTDVEVFGKEAGGQLRAIDEEICKRDEAMISEDEERFPAREGDFRVRMTRFPLHGLSGEVTAVAALGEISEHNAEEG